MSANCGNPFRQGDIYDQTWFASLSYLQLFQHDLTEILSILQQSQDARGKEQKEVPMVLLGNKGDMVHLRQVSSEEGDLTMIEIILDIQILPWRLNTLKRTFSIQNLYKIGLNYILIFCYISKMPPKLFAILVAAKVWGGGSGHWPCFVIPARHTSTFLRHNKGGKGEPRVFSLYQGDHCDLNQALLV